MNHVFEIDSYIMILNFIIKSISFQFDIYPFRMVYKIILVVERFTNVYVIIFKNLTLEKGFVKIYKTLQYLSIFLVYLNKTNLIQKRHFTY